MGYYSNPRYNPSPDLYKASTLIGPNTGNWQTKARGTNDQEYQIYLACADDGKGGRHHPRWSAAQDLR